MISYTQAYKFAKDYIKNDRELINELGEIKGFGFIATGGIQISNNPNGEQGSATFILIVKGEKKYKEVTVIVNKEVDSDWKAEEIK